MKCTERNLLIFNVSIFVIWCVLCAALLATVLSGITLQQETRTHGDWAVVVSRILEGVLKGSGPLVKKKETRAT
jgi:hypothetical protein